MYTLAASAAGVGMLALAHSAEAKIIYTKAHVVLGARSNMRYDLDVNHDGWKDFTFSHFFTVTTHASVSAVQMNPYKSNTNRVMGSRYASALRIGDKIGSSGHFSGSGLMAGEWARPHSQSIQFFGAWANDGKGLSDRYLGLRFSVKDKIHYGWARVSVSKFRFVGTLTGYAYETIPNKPIIAGQTRGKDEATLGHLATGASAIPAWRVKQTAATTH